MDLYTSLKSMLYLENVEVSPALEYYYFPCGMMFMVYIFTVYIQRK